MEKTLIDEIAEALNMERDEISAVIDEFVLQLHRRQYEYKGLNGDYLGEELHYHITKKAYYHLLGFLDTFSERYEWDSASEYLLRLGKQSEWMPFKQQIKSWEKRSK